jgi:hypothetical protein
MPDIEQRLRALEKRARADHWLKVKNPAAPARVAYMSNLLEQAINTDDGARAAKITQGCCILGASRIS